MQSNGQAFQPGTQERNTAISISLFLPRDCKTRANSVTLQITIYETNNTPLPQQYRRWMHSTVNQLRQHTNDHAKQREHARCLRIQSHHSQNGCPKAKAPKSSGRERDHGQKGQENLLRLPGPGSQSGIRRWTQRVPGLSTAPRRQEARQGRSPGRRDVSGRNDGMECVGRWRRSLGTDGRAGTVIEQPSHVTAPERLGSSDTRNSAGAFLPLWRGPRVCSKHSRKTE